MFEFGLYVLGAFFLYVLLLPLAGALVGFVIYMGLPHLMSVAIACIAHKKIYGSYFDLGAFWILALVLSVGIVYIRQIYQKTLEMGYEWHEGYFLASKTILELGLPYRKIKKEQWRLS